MNRARFIDPAVVAYAAAHSTGPDPVLTELRAATRERAAAAAGMQIGDDQALFMEMLARAMGARRAIEIGTFTGTSALAVARGMGPEGRLLCCDLSEEWTAIAREFWQRAGVAERIELRLGPALDTLRSLPSDPVFDFAFVDADKAAYLDYFAELVPRLRPGGLLLADNTLWGGRVLDGVAEHTGTEPVDDDTAALRAFNDRVATTPGVAVLLLPMGDGVTVIQKL